MPVYEFVCDKCRIIWEEYRKFKHASDVFLCESCLAPCKRKFSVAVHRDLAEHYNPAVGKVVSSNREFKSELDKLSAEHSEARGFDVKYVPMDLSDKTALGISEVGLDATYNKQIARGQREKKLYG